MAFPTSRDRATRVPDVSAAPGATPASERDSIDANRLAQAVEGAGRLAWVGRLGTLPLRRGWLRVRHEGRDNVPSEGGVLLAANHLAFVDSPLVMYSLPRPVVFLGKSDYLDNAVAGRVFPAMGMLPLDRSGRKARVTFDRTQEILAEGGIVGVHPEGTRSRDGLLGPGHRGVAQLALRADVPVVPVGLIGTDRVQPLGRKIPRFRGEVIVRYGAPIGLGRWASARRSARSRAELTEEIMQSIAALTGQGRRQLIGSATAVV